MSQVNTSMNFLPEDYVEKRQATRTAIVFIGLLLLVVGGIVGAYLYGQWKNLAKFHDRDMSRMAVEDASKKIAEAQELENQKGRMIAKADTITALMERVRRSLLLSELTRLRPSGVNFVSLDLKTKELDNPKPNAALDQARRNQAGGPSDVKPIPSDVVVTLMGTAPTDADVAAYLTALQKSMMLNNVTLVFSEEYKKNKEDQAVRRFNFEMHINPDADFRGGTPVTSAMPKE